MVAASALEILGRYENAAFPVAENIGRPIRAIEGDDGKARGHGLDDDMAEAFPAGGQHEQIGMSIIGRGIGNVARQRQAQAELGGERRERRPLGPFP